MPKSDPKAAVALINEARGLSGDFDALSQAVAERVGLSPRELLAMDLVTRGDPVTPGDIARHLRLTTGAITGLIDRMEGAGFVKRRPDPADRRRLFVLPTAKGDRIADSFAPLAAALRQATAGYSPDQLRLIAEFVRVLRRAVADTTDSVGRRTSGR